MSQRNFYFGSLEGEVEVNLDQNNGEEDSRETFNQPQPIINLISNTTATSASSTSYLNSQNTKANEEFDRRALAKTLKIPTSDSSVRSLLISLNQPITLFGEGPGERRDRLKLMASRAITSLPRAFELFPCLKELCGDNLIGGERSHPKFKEDEDDDEEFYIPGSTNLVKVRSFLLEDSISRHIPRKFDHSTEISIRSSLYSKLNHDLDLRWSTIDPNGRPLSTCTFTPDGNLFTGDWAGRLMKYHSRISGSANNYDSQLITSTGDRISATCASNTDDLLLVGTSAGKIDFIGKNHQVSLPTCHAIKSINWHPSNHFFASTSSDSLWRLWDVQSATEIQVQEGHLDGVSAGAWHPDGALFCTGGSSDGIIRIWDCRLGKSIWSNFVGSAGASASPTITSLSFSPQLPHILASSDSDGFLKLHDLRKLETSYAKSAAHRSCCSGLKFIAGGRAIVTAGFDGFLRIWSPGDLRLIKEYQVTNSKVTALDAFESGESLKLAAVSFDRNVKIFS